MPSSQPRRRVATVLFADIVGSTALASELGDEGWRRVLGRFRQAVRRELKRWHGREQDTAGDGFYATFSEPARGLSAAAAIVAAVQELGLDVRIGLHTGECEEIDGKLTGIAVHIGARVMAAAGAAEVLATRTTRDLVVGSDAAFEEAGTRELKGVEGAWLLYRLVSVSQRLPEPLAPEVAAERLATVVGEHRYPVRWPLAAGVVAAGAAIAVILAFTVFGSSSPAKAASLLRIDPASNRVVATVRDAHPGCNYCGAGGSLWDFGGALWEQGGGVNHPTVMIRSLASGALQHTFRLPANATGGWDVGDGALWVAHPVFPRQGGTTIAVVDRINPLSGRRTARVRIPGQFLGGGVTVAVGNGALWALRADGTLFRIDPATNRITGRLGPVATTTMHLIPAQGDFWFCECDIHEVLRFDPRTGIAKTFHYAQEPWELVPVLGTKQPTLWLLDTRDATITRVDPATGRAGTPLGLVGRPTQAVFSHGSMWLAAGKVVDRVRLSNGHRTVIRLPRGTYATGIAADPATGAIWIDNSVK